MLGLQSSRATMEMAKLFSDPIRAELPLWPVLGEIAEFTAVEPGEDAYFPSAYDTTYDCMTALNTSTHVFTPLQVSPTASAAVSFQSYVSPLTWIGLDAIMSSRDQDKIARDKQGIINSMDKQEARLILDGITGDTADVPGVNTQTYSVVSGNNIFNVIQEMYLKVHSYGSDVLLLVGTDVFEAIVKWDLAQASTLNYRCGIYEWCDRMGITIKEVSELCKIANTSGTASTHVLDENYLVMVARKTVQEPNRKPITFVRRKLSPQILADGKYEVVNPQRVFVEVPAPVQNGSNAVLGSAIAVYEQIAAIITNPYAICKCDASSIV